MPTADDSDRDRTPSAVERSIPTIDEVAVDAETQTEAEAPTAETQLLPAQLTGEATQLFQPDAAAAGSGTVRSGPAAKEFGGYELVEEIARGGMGVVFKARQKQLNRTVALKMILAGQLAGAEEVQRFHAEAEAAASLEHSGIVPIYEVGEHDGRHFFSMGFVEGTTLSQLVRDSPVDGRRAARLMSAVADAIAYAHDHEVVHRDLKPSNILLDADGQPRVTDFGLAKRTNMDSGLTGTGQVLGTPSYMAPEQAAGDTKRIGPLSDVYALGATLYCLITGRPPFQAANVMDTLMAVMKQEPVSPRQLNPSIDRDLETICLKCLQKELPARYQSATELKDELDRFLNGEPIRARAISTTVRTWRWCRRNRIVSSLLALVVVVVMVGVGVSLFLAGEWKDAARLAVEESGRANAAARTVKLERDVARNERDSAREARENEAISRRNAERQISELYLERGQQLCDEGELARGLLWMARSMAAVPDQSESLDRIVRLSFESRLPQLNVLKDFVQQGPHYPLELSADCSRIVVLSDSDHSLLTMWDTGRRIPLDLEFQHDGEVTVADLTPDVAWLYSVVGSTGRIHQWNVRTGDLVSVFENGAPVGPIAIHPSGKELLFADTTVKRLDVERGEIIGEPIEHPDEILTVAYSPDGERIAIGGEDRTVRIRDTESGELIGLPMANSSAATVVEFSPDGNSLAIGGDDGVRLWDLVTGIPQWHGRHSGRIYCLAFDAGGKRLASGGYDQNGRVWSVSTGEMIGQPLEHGFSVTTVGFPPGGDSVVSASYYQIRTWQITGEKPQNTIYRAESAVPHFDVSADGRFVALAAGDRALVVRNGSATAGVVQSLQHPDAVKSAEFDPSGRRVLTRCDDGFARVWNLDSDQLFGEPMPQTLRGPARWNQDGSRIFTLTDQHTVQLWDAAVGKPVGAPIKHGGPINSVRFTPDGRQLLTAGGRKDVRVWNAESGAAMTDAPLIDHPIQPAVIDFSPDGKRVLVSGFHTVLVKSTETGEILHTLPHQGFHLAVRFSPDGNTILTTSRDSTVKLWDANTFEPVGHPIAHSGHVAQVEFSPDSRLVVTRALDRSLRVIDVQSARITGWLPTLEGELEMFAFSSDGSALLTSSSEGRVQSWPLAGEFESSAAGAELITEWKTGLEMDADGAVAELYLQAWYDRRRDLGIPHAGLVVDVTNTNDHGDGSLRQALQITNHNYGPDTIQFHIPGNGPHSIRPASSLPRLSDAVTIDATTQPGYSGTPLIEIDGTLCDVTNDGGLFGITDDCHIRGLCINRFPWCGIILANSSHSTIEACYIGTSVTGTEALGNGRLRAGPGIAMWGRTAGNRIGTDGDGIDDEAEINLISGNTTNAISVGADLTGHEIRGNLIGTDRTGELPIPNLAGGLLIRNGATGNVIERNTILVRQGKHHFVVQTEGNTITNNVEKTVPRKRK